MLTLQKRIVIFLRDAVSFIIYILIYFRKRSGNVVLVYHSIGRVDPKEDPYMVNILPEVFNRHLKTIFGLKEKVEITFDDGYGNNFRNAFPLLKKYNLNATFFLATDFIDGKIDPEYLGGKNFRERPLAWDEVKIMDRAGMRFGSHSKTHQLLTKISEDELQSELLDSRRRIEEVLGHKIDSFSYPFGDRSSFNDLIKEAVIGSKYNYAYTNIMGCNATASSDKFILRRIRIYGEDGPFKLKMKIKGAYDWVDALR